MQVVIPPLRALSAMPGRKVGHLFKKVRMPKSFVSLEQHQCPVCLTKHDTGAILMSKRGLPRFNQHTVTGLGFCPECKQKYDDGFVALVALSREPNMGEDALTVPRTGVYAHIRAAVWDKVFNVPLPAGGIAACPTEVIEMLQNRASEPA